VVSPDIKLPNDWFDLIGVTSTGAIIAAGLAAGYSAGAIQQFYSLPVPPFGHLFRFHRCDVKLEEKWLADHLGVDLSHAEALA
jgi:hypothetical protein